jgi:hypothetical protein
VARRNPRKNPSARRNVVRKVEETGWFGDKYFPYPHYVSSYDESKRFSEFTEAADFDFALKMEAKRSASAAWAEFKAEQERAKSDRRSPATSAVVYRDTDGLGEVQIDGTTFYLYADRKGNGYYLVKPRSALYAQVKGGLAKGWKTYDEATDLVTVNRAKKEAIQEIQAGRYEVYEATRNGDDFRRVRGVNILKNPRRNPNSTGYVAAKIRANTARRNGRDWRDGFLSEHNRDGLDWATGPNSGLLDYREKSDDDLIDIYVGEKYGSVGRALSELKKRGWTQRGLDKMIADQAQEEYEGTPDWYYAVGRHL